MKTILGQLCVYELCVCVSEPVIMLVCVCVNKFTRMQQCSDIKEFNNKKVKNVA